MPLFTFAFTMLTSEPPVMSTPVAFGPLPPPTTVCGASLLPIATLLEPPLTRMPVASPEVRVTPWALTPAIEELVTALIVTAGAVPVPKIVVTWSGPKSLKSCAQPPVMFMLDTRLSGPV